MATSLLFRKKKQTAMESKLVGLKTLAEGRLDCPCPSNCVNRNFVASRLVSPPVLTDEDTRSRAEDEREEEEEDEEDNACWGNYGRGNGRRFPPAIPLLARTGNLSCHMPWVLKRNYKADGSLVITEVRVRHHEYFRTRRANGRLVLQLVELDENSRLFDSGPKSEIVNNDDEEVHSDEERLSSSSSSPTSPLSCAVKEDEAIRTRENNEEAEYEAGTGKPSRSVVSSMMMLSSSMPEPTFPVRVKKAGCFPDRSGSSLLRRMPLSRMRPVRV